MSLAIKAGRARSQGGMAGRVRSGDPGLLGDLWGGVKKIGGAVLGGAAGLLTGGPVGAVTGAASGLGLSAGPKITPAGVTPTMPGVVPTPGIVGAGQRAVPGGATGYQLSGAPPKGYRLNKSGYFLKDGTYVAPETRYVKMRRRNSMNPKALSRAISRVDGGKAIQHRLSQITTAKYTAAGARKK